MKSRTLLTTSALLLASASVSAATTYTVTLLGMDGSGMRQVSGINKWGQVIGTDSTPHAVLWTPTAANATAGSLYDLQTTTGFPSGAATSGASGINDRGQVVGGAYTPGQGDGNQTQSWMWRPGLLNSRTGTLHGTGGRTTTFALITIPSLGTASEYPSGINNNGQIVGRAIYYHPVLWTPTYRNGRSGTWAYEPTYCAPASAINDAGEIAGGTCQSSENVPYLHAGAFPLVASDLITSSLWPSPPSPNGIGGVSGMNQAGDLAISAASATTNQIRAYLYRAGIVTDISGNRPSNAYALNNKDQVAGKDTVNNNALLFDSGTVTDLNTLIPAPPAPAYWHMGSAVGINDAGQIICNGSYNNGSWAYSVSAAFLLTPVQ